MAAKFLIPGAGWMAKKTESFSRNQDAYSTSGFGGLNSSALTAEANAGAKLLFGRDKANALINK